MSGKALDGAKAKEELNRRLTEGKVVYTRHFLDELRDDDLIIGDALYVCRSGRIQQPPECDIKTGHWKYRIEGPVPDHGEVAVVFRFGSDDAVFITVFRRSK